MTNEEIRQARINTLQHIKAETEEREKRAEEKRREEMESQIKHLVQVIVNYFINNNMCEYDFEIIMGFFSTELSEYNSITQNYLHVYNGQHTNKECEVFHNALKNELKNFKILYRKKFYMGGDFGPSPDKLKIHLEII